MEYLIRDDTLAGIAAEVKRLAGTEEAMTPDGMRELLSAVEVGGGSSEKVAAIADGSITELTAEDFGNAYTIREYAFYGCRYLNRVTISDSVRMMGAYAFNGCTSLEYVKMPYSISVGTYAFQNCSAIDTLEFTVGTGSNLSGSSYLPRTYVKNVILGKGITTIVESFLSGNGSSVVNVYIPNTITSIGQNAFRYCSKLTNVYYEGTEEEWADINVGDGNDNLLSATIHYNAPM